MEYGAPDRDIPRAPFRRHQASRPMGNRANRKLASGL
jgi:hypothetical protein